MRGVILAGGSGTRLHPLTISVSKQLLPVYNKPMIYYPISTLMLAGVQEILIISTPRDLPQFEYLLGDGSDWGISIEYQVQEEPKGIAQGLLLAEEFLGKSTVCLALGDNIFYGAGVGETLAQYETSVGATILAQAVSDPSRYGIVVFDESGKALNIEEKPSDPKSSFAIPGLYFFDNTAVQRAKTLKPSNRGELEITDLNRSYLDDGVLFVKPLPRGTAWLDTGTIDSLAQAAEFVKVVEQRQGFMISSPEEIAWRMGYIDSPGLRTLAEKFGKTEYGEYLKRLLS
jgi:glucose-1-phosphate thymidylyltransferase